MTSVASVWRFHGENSRAIMTWMRIRWSPGDGHLRRCLGRAITKYSCIIGGVDKCRTHKLYCLVNFLTRGGLISGFSTAGWAASTRIGMGLLETQEKKKKVSVLVLSFWTDSQLIYSLPILTAQISNCSWQLIIDMILQNQKGSRITKTSKNYRDETVASEELNTTRWETR